MCSIYCYNNATAADYMCQLFSTYSPNDVEDKQVVAVVFSGQLIFTHPTVYMCVSCIWWLYSIYYCTTESPTVNPFILAVLKF